VGSVDTILKRFRPTVGMNEGSGEAISKTIKSLSQMPVYRETDDIIIDLTDSKNIQVFEFNRSYFELYLDFTIDLFKACFQFSQRMLGPSLSVIVNLGWIGLRDLL
jgi:hypothetical protein